MYWYIYYFSKKAELEKEVMKSAKFMENDKKELGTDTQEGLHAYITY